MNEDAFIGDLSLLLYVNSVSFSQYYDSAHHNPLLGE